MPQAVSINQFIRGSIGVKWFITIIIGVLSVVVLVLAVAGVHSLSLHTQRQRLREYGLRAALGATRTSIVLTVLWASLKPILLGQILGISLVVILSEYISKFFPNAAVDIDVITVIMSAALMSGVSIITILLLAVRSAREAPNKLIRYE